MVRSQHIGVLAGERVAIFWGAVLRELKRFHSDVSFSGIGEQMVLRAYKPVRHGAVIGFWFMAAQAVARAVSIRRSVAVHQVSASALYGYRQSRLQLGVEQKLRHKGIKTAT